GGFQAGTYQLSPGASMTELAETIWTGKVLEDSFTIPEGWNLGQMSRYFDQLGWFSADEFMAEVDKALANRPAWLPDSIDSLEGFLFPDTYQIPVDARTASSVVDVMLRRFEQTALPLYEEYGANSDLDLQEWVTLASIIEKEAVVDEERATISGVFVNRLEQGIPLGSDPTVEYGLGITQTPESPLTLRQVNTPSPYNTYRNPGLTPTPIAAPGYASLEVALKPQETEYLYFVARYDGTHVFSRTLGEHERAQGEIRDRIDAQRN
ncbi:MAG: endolytic transglycosylase MltG, partial [Cyanobacteria bacterium P01_F01_bin.42]